jgi:hypothetical protein
VEPGEDALLQLAREIDEHVAADEEVDVREGRRLGEIVRTEDAPAADVAPQAVELPVAIEVAVDQEIGDVLELIQAIDGVASGGQRLLIDIRPVDPDHVLRSAVAEALGQENG